MSVIKRSLALGLAFAMIVMTGTMLTMKTTYAAATPGTIDIKNVTRTPNSYTDKVTVTFEVEHKNNPLAYDAVKTSSNVTMDSNSDFKDGELKVTKILSVSTDSNIVKYQITATDIAVKSGKSGSSLNLKLKVVEGSTYDSGVMTIAISGYNGGGTSPDPTPPPVTPTEASAKYTVSKVRATKRVNDTDVPNDDRVYFDINNLTSSSDASIRQTYFADITLRIFDEKAPEGIVTTDIIGAGVSMDMGSFYFKRGNAESKYDSTIEILNSVEGYYEVKLTGMRYSGNSNKLTFRTRKGNYIGDITAVITECVTRQDASKEPTDDDDDDDSKLEVETPYVIVSKYSYGGGSVTAGDTFPLSLTIYNTSETEVVGNMMVTVTMPEGLMLTSSSNTFYIEELDKHASITKSMQVTAKVDAKPQSHNVGVAMKYQYVDDRVNSRRSAETTENIAIPVIQVDRFQVTGVDIPMEAMLGEETSVTVNFVNKGRSEAYNISAAINGNIQNPGQNQNLGNLASGATGTADFYILPTEVGMCTGEITITYEDTNMLEKTATIRYNTTVKSPEEFMGGGMMVGPGGMGGEEMPPMDEPKKSNLPMIIIGCVIVAIPVLIIVKKKLDAKRKEREDADL